MQMGHWQNGRVFSLFPSQYDLLSSQTYRKKFSELQKEARIQAMKRLLSTTKMPVSKIAEEVGYSIKFASTVFKQEIGMTMSQY